MKYLFDLINKAIEKINSTKSLIQLVSDLDCDGIDDAWEDEYNLDPTDPRDSAQDADSDGVTNRDEYFWGIDPHNPDTDGDGISDGTEIAQGTDPTVPEPGPTYHWIYLPLVIR